MTIPTENSEIITPSAPIDAESKEIPQLQPEESKPSGSEGDGESKSENKEEGYGEDKQGEEPKRSAWYMKEIGGLRQKSQNLKVENEALQRRIQELSGNGDASSDSVGDSSNPAKSNPQFEEAVRREAARIAAINSHAMAANAIAEKGAKEINKFQEDIDVLHAIGALYYDQETPTPLMQVVAEMSDGHKILHHLAKDPEKAKRIAAGSEAERTRAIIEIRQSLSKPQDVQISSAPDPIKPLQAKGKADLPIEDPKLSREEFSRRRQEARMAKYK